MKKPGEWYLIPLTLVLACGVLLLPLWLRGGSQGHDLFHHLLSGHYFALQLWQGELYPRWLMAMNGGFGSPTFFFYPPLPYYVSALFAGPQPLAHQAIYPLLWSASLALLLSGLFAYLWLRRFSAPGRALAASLLYLALPYHLAMDLYARFALAEFWAFVWAPLVLLGQDLAGQRRRGGFLLLALALALLAFTHLPSLLLMLALITLRALLQTWRSRTSFPLRITLAAQVLGLAMAAALLLPALLDQGAISMELMRGGMFDFRRNFLDRLPSGWGDWRFRGHLAWQSLLTMGLLLLAWAAAREPRHPELLCWGVLGVGAFLMMLPLSQPIWHLLPPLQRLQFPWRCNLILTLATVAVVALGTPVKQPWQGIWWSLLLITLVSSLAYVYYAPLTQAPLKTVIDAEFDSKRSAREYRPIQVPSGRFTPTLLAWKEEFQPPVTTEQQGAEWTLVRWQPRWLELAVRTQRPTRLILHQYDYPGWQARLDDSLTLAVSANRQGLLQVWVPAGQHRLSLRLTARWPERWGGGISLLGWLCWLLLAYRGCQAPKRQ
ncbi:6-pyruvoyl-tetrahydropterin synthase-related protein [Aeromonas bestiarum]|uniref:6-pyruvoyl-tetrahydropterin synthase-related protein n=1 Tax=Aeromonas bestiarum TaxID=105751 RepID=UPI003672D117